METKTLENAVRDEIKAFIDNGCEFTVYTITQNIRHKVNSKLLTISYISDSNQEIVETVDINGVNTQKIDHAKVRKLVETLYFSGVLYIDRQFNGTYYVYNYQNATNSTKVQNASVMNQCIVKKITDYFDNRINHGNPATLHSTQNRLKRTPLSLKEIESIAVKNGYYIVQNSSLSNALVKKY